MVEDGVGVDEVPAAAVQAASASSEAGSRDTEAGGGEQRPEDLIEDGAPDEGAADEEIRGPAG